MPTGARKNSTFIAVSIVPNVCKTPMGASMVPVPYPIMADLSDSVEVAKTVQFNDDPVFLLSDSVVTRVTGNEPGTGGGMKSGVNCGKVRATQSSRSVRVEKRYVVRHGDECDMNLSS
ncbi:DUF4150 domain-containing protein [Pseudoduganella armeniaca]|uniref:Type IV secretion protein Rhs n=1 Tax=Pseudoduganella armeniaca TaxID=2072590 RepID=A0A2R4C416_9BURK|nr:DUF4150 domain-containing protein [Pseudoduganella armeniaca]AVR94356.1 type IV secretion protein Rhs [Pseudoduganella armeniaca]